MRPQEGLIFGGDSDKTQLVNHGVYLGFELEETCFYRQAVLF